MPLTLEFKTQIDKNEYLYGQFVIDRDNLIIRFKPENNKIATEKIKNDFENIFSIKIKELRNTIPLEKLNDAEHLIEYHLSENDKLDYHLHCKFKDNIQLKDVESIFNKIMESPKLSELISFDECYLMYKVCREYFKEQADFYAVKDVKDVEDVEDVETDYRIHKEVQLELARIARGETELEIEDDGIKALQQRFELLANNFTRGVDIFSQKKDENNHPPKHNTTSTLRGSIKTDSKHTNNQTQLKGSKFFQEMSLQRESKSLYIEQEARVKSFSTPNEESSIQLKTGEPFKIRTH